MSDMGRQSLGDKAGAALKMSLFDLVDFSTFATRQYNYLTFSLPLSYPDSEKSYARINVFPRLSTPLAYLFSCY